VKKIRNIVFFCTIITACNSGGSADLKIREARLAQQEQEFAQKQADYKSLLAMRDSLNAAKSTNLDSAEVPQTWPDSIQGQWNSRLVCRSSTCNSYVIGDQRNEQWQFLADSGGLFVRATSRNKTVQLFKGTLRDNQIILNKERDSIGDHMAQIQIKLDMLGSKIIKGTQIIRTKADCEANFSVELTPKEK